MAVLQNLTQNKKLISDLRVAKTFLARGLGLIPKKTMTGEEGLLFFKTQAIHTCFMSFAIDCVFVDENLKVVALLENLKPWRFSKLYWRAYGVIELAGGSIKRLNIQMGDQLHVGH